MGVCDRIERPQAADQVCRQQRRGELLHQQADHRNRRISTDFHTVFELRDTQLPSQGQTRSSCPNRQKRGMTTPQDLHSTVRSTQQTLVETVQRSSKTHQPTIQWPCVTKSICFPLLSCTPRLPQPSCALKQIVLLSSIVFLVVLVCSPRSFPAGPTRLSARQGAAGRCLYRKRRNGAKHKRLY